MVPLPAKRRVITVGLVDAVSCCCAIVVVTLILLSSLREVSVAGINVEANNIINLRGNKVVLRPACEEIYVVGEGETLQTIIDKCGDPFIVEKNPHIHDPDDVFPGLVIKITPHST